jgi:hypothetical protein
MFYQKNVVDHYEELEENIFAIELYLIILCGQGIKVYIYVSLPDYKTES